MQRSLCTLCLYFGFLMLLHAQQGVTVYGFPLDTIQQWVEESPEELQAINEKCLHPDSIVYEEEYFLLYYGSAYLDGYSPYGEKMLASEVYELLDKEKYQQAVELCLDQVRQHPAYCRGYYNLAVSYDYLGDSTMTQIYLDRFYGLLGTAFYSGSGTSMDSAFVVRSVDDEYLIIRELGYQRNEQHLIDDDAGVPYDMLTVFVDEETGETTDLFFNIYQPYELGLKKMFMEAKLEEEQNESKEKPGKRRRKRRKDRG